MTNGVRADVKDDAHERAFTIYDEQNGMWVSMSRRIRRNSMWRGFWSASVRSVEATTV